MVVVVVLGVLMVGCAAEEQRATEEREYSAARLNGKFRQSDPLVQMLSPQERQALVRAGMLDESEVEADDPDAASGDDASSSPDAQKSTTEKAGDVMLSVLKVGVTLGMMAAPYLLF